MATFQQYEVSADQGRPIELYKFDGTLETYTFTSGNKIITFGGNTYRPIPVNRTEIKLGDVNEKNELKITMPITAKVIRDYAFDIPPPDLELTIFRLHEVEGVVPWFKGTVTSLTVEGNQASIAVPSKFTSYMSSDFPNVLFQSQCNHRLYSPGCGVDRELFRRDGVVESITSRTVIRVPEAANEDGEWFKAGEIVVGTERRLVVDHQGSTLTLNYPFRSLNVGDEVIMYAGCLHTSVVCQQKFNNGRNFLGFEWTPSLNPFLKGLR